jgi:hypothetical protein
MFAFSFFVLLLLLLSQLAIACLHQALKFTVAKYYTPSGRCIQATEYGDAGSARKAKGKDAAAAKALPAPLPQEPIAGEPKAATPSVNGVRDAAAAATAAEEEAAVAAAAAAEDEAATAEDGGEEATGERAAGERRASSAFSSKAVTARKAWTTAHGRTVRDGGGVEVDVKVAGAKLPAVEALLLSQGVLFDFATAWTQVDTIRQAGDSLFSI